LRDLLDVCRFGGKNVANAIQLEASGIDGLTGLSVHTNGMEDLDKMISRWKRRKDTMLAPVALMMDLDDFKKVNDGKIDPDGNIVDEGAAVEGKKLGHQVGDQVLHIAGKRLLDAIRTEDDGTRYGGEEMAAWLEDCKDPEAVAERIRLSIAEPMKVTLDDGSNVELRITASIGFTRVDEKEAELGVEGARKCAIGRADAAMYIAKKKRKEHGNRKVKMKRRNMIVACYKSRVQISKFIPRNTASTDAITMSVSAALALTSRSPFLNFTLTWTRASAPPVMASTLYSVSFTLVPPSAFSMAEIAASTGPSPMPATTFISPFILSRTLAVG